MRNVVALGLRRGLIEMRQSLTTTSDVVWIITINAIFVVVLLLQRNATVPGTDVSLAAATLPGLIGMNVALGGWMGTVSQLSAEREDGTLLRAKATPNGMSAYLVSRITLAALNTAFGVVVFLVAGLFVIDGLTDVPLTGWLTLVAVFVLGLLATLPWGAVVGSLVRTATAGFGFSILPMAVLVGISGIFYPISGLPGWLHPIAQVFPVYWLGLGMRSALLPVAAAAGEIGGSWRHLETFGVLGLWAAVGLAVAPRILRRMAERESGSYVAERREVAIQRGY